MIGVGDKFTALAAMDTFTVAVAVRVPFVERDEQIDGRMPEACSLQDRGDSTTNNPQAGSLYLLVRTGDGKDDWDSTSTWSYTRFGTNNWQWH